MADRSIVVRLHPDGTWRYLGFDARGAMYWFPDRQKAEPLSSEAAHLIASRRGREGWDVHVRTAS